MTGTPTTPKRLTIIDRIVTVLTAITVGTDYFVTPTLVTKRTLADTEIVTFPVYMVQDGAEAGPPENYSNQNYCEVMTVSIKGVVDAPDGNSVDNVEKSIRDVRRAIMQDTLPAAGSGSLGSLGVLVFMGAVRTDSGLYGLDGFGTFELEIQARFYGSWADL